MHLTTLWSRVVARFRRPSIVVDERGEALLRYLLVFVLVAAVFVAAFTRYGDVIFEKFDSLADAIRRA